MRKSLVVVLSVSLLVLTVSGLSYAYFKNYGITKEEHLSVVAKKLAVIFTDNSELTGEIYPGYEETKTFSVENRSESLFKYDIIFEDLVNTFETEGFLQYKITSNDGGFNCDWTDIPKSTKPTDSILAYSVEIENGKKHNYKLEIRYQNSETEDQSADMGKVLSGNLAITEGVKPILSKLLADNSKIGIRSDFSKPFDQLGIEAGLYKESGNFTEDLDNDGKGEDVYYFVGNPSNNWVKFGGFWWRIIRTNEDGSTRLLYVGTSPNTTEGYINISAFNENSDNPKYGGYMYGDGDTLEDNRKNDKSSTIKSVIDKWYEDNLVTKYGLYLSRTAIYCNDRATSSYSTNSMDYAARDRLVLNKSKRPSFKCGNNESGFCMIMQVI